MNDEFAAPPAPEPGPSKPAGPALRPPPGRKPAPPPRPPSNLKKYLVLGIIFATVILLGLIGWRGYLKLFGAKPPPARNIKVEWENAWNSARNANKEIFEKVESKVWTKGEDLTNEDLANLKTQLTVLEKTAEKYHELLELLRSKGQMNSQEAKDMGETQIVLKTWIWDASDVLDPAKKPPAYGGLYIPMYKAEKKREEANSKLREIREKAQEIIGRNDPAEIEATVAEIRKVRDRFAEVRDEFLRLDEELIKGLTMPDLQESQLRELAELREYASKATMGFKEAREAISLFPRPEDMKPPEEPKPEPPKPEDPKPPEPPAPDPPKPDPPKSDPPKSDPPKTEEPK